MATGFPRYKYGDYGRPDNDIDPKLKNQEGYALDWAKFIYSYAYSNNYVPFSRRDWIERMRAYSDGRQSTDKYMKQFEGVPDTPDYFHSNGRDHYRRSEEYARAGLSNIEYNVVSIFPKFKRILLGKWRDINHKIIAKATDPLSGQEKENEKWRMIDEVEQKDFYDSFFKLIGIEQDQDQYKPENTEEIKMFEEMGGFKLAHEIAMELIVEHNLDVSDYENDIRDKMFEDLIDINFAVSRDYVDERTNKIKAEYIDPSYFIAQYSRAKDYKDSEFMGHIRFYTINELRKELPHVTEDQLFSIAEDWAGDLGNPYLRSGVDAGDHFNQYNEYNSNAYYNDWRIPVMFCEWRTIDTYYDTTRINKYNRKVTYEDTYGKVRDSEKKKTKVTPIEAVYETYWVVGTDYVFKNRKRMDTSRNDQTKEVFLSHHPIRIEGQSMVEAAQPHLDSYQMWWYKLQDAKSKAAPSGIAVEWESISSITMNGKKLKPLDVLKIRTQTGDFVYRMKTTGLHNVSGNNAGRPITELAGGIGPIFQEILTGMESDIRSIQTVTGVSSSADASAPTPDTSVRGSEMALAATNDNLSKYYSEFLVQKEYLARNICYRTQVLINTDKKFYESYYPVIGYNNLKTIKVAGKVASSHYGIKLEAMATNAMKQELYESMRVALQSGKNGIPSLQYSQYLYLFDYLESGGSIKNARRMLAYFESKEYKKNAQEAAQTQERQGQMTIQRDMANNQAKAAMTQNESSLRTNEERVKEIEKRKTLLFESKLNRGEDLSLDDIY